MRTLPKLIGSLIVAQVLLFSALLHAAENEDRKPPEVSVGKDAQARCLMPTSEEVAESVQTGDGKITIRGVWKKCNVEIISRRSMGVASVFDFARTNALGGYDFKPYYTTDEKTIVELQLRILSPAGAKVIDVSTLALADDSGMTYQPVGFDVAKTPKPSEMYGRVDNGLVVVEEQDNPDLQYFAIGNATTPTGTIMLLQDEGTTRALPVRLLFEVPASNKALVLQAVEKRKEDKKPPANKQTMQTQPTPSTRSLSPQQKPTSLVVRVPAEAMLELEGIQTTVKGEVRRFRIPELPVGKEFSYRLKASWNEDGSERTVDRKVPLRAGDAAEIDLRKPIGWPRYTGELAGSQEVRVKKPNPFKVTVGLRSDGRGKDFTVSDNSMNSIFVPNGKYEIYFQYSTDLDGLYQGDSFTLTNNGVEIQIVKVVNGNYGIKKVN